MRGGSELLISVIVPNYNHGQYLNNRIKSILSQIGENGELIVIDDASTDNSLAIIDSWYTRDLRLKVIKNAENIGVVATANKGLFQARGKYITFLASDDFLLPGFVEKTLEVLLKHPEVPLCCSDFGYVTSEAPEEIKAHILIKKARDIMVYNSPQKVIRLFRYNPFGIPGHTSIFKRESVLKRGGFRPELAATCDWFLLNSIALEEGFIYLPETLSVMRVSKSSYSSKINKDLEQRNASYLCMFDLLLAKENRELCSRFMQAALLDRYVRQVLCCLMKHPKYWNFCINTFFSYFRRRLRKWGQLFPKLYIRHLKT